MRVPANGARSLRLLGFASGQQVANRKERLGPRPDGSVGVQPGATLVRAPAAAVPTRLRFLVSAPGAERLRVQRQVRAVFGTGWKVEPLFDLDSGLTPNPDLADFFAVTGSLGAGSDDERRARAFELSRNLMRHTGYLLSRAGASGRRQFAERLAQLGLTPRTWGALNVQANGGRLVLSLSPVQSILDSIEVFDGQRRVYARMLRLAPLQRCPLALGPADASRIISASRPPPASGGAPASGEGPASGAGMLPSVTTTSTMLPPTTSTR